MFNNLNRKGSKSLHDCVFISFLVVLSIEFHRLIHLVATARLQHYKSIEGSYSNGLICKMKMHVCTGCDTWSIKSFGLPRSFAHRSPLNWSNIFDFGCFPSLNQIFPLGPPCVSITNTNMSHWSSIVSNVTADIHMSDGGGLYYVWILYY